jgi:hypothetical protein
MRADAAPKPEREKPLFVRLQERVNTNGIEDPKITLGEILEQLAGKYELPPFVVNEKAFQPAQFPVPVLKLDIIGDNPIPPMKNVRLDTLLRTILGRVPVEAGATFTIREDRIEITTVSAQIAEFWSTRRGWLEGPPIFPLVHADFDKIPLDGALKALADQAEVSIVLDRSAVGPAMPVVTARFANVPLDTAVIMLTRMTDLRTAPIGKALFVSSASRAIESRPERPEQLLFVKLMEERRFKGFDDPKTTLSELLDQLSLVYGLPFEINDRAFKLDNLKNPRKEEILNPDPIPEFTGSMSQMLTRVLNRVPSASGATYTIRPNHIEITTVQAQRTEFWPDLPDGPFFPMIHASLNKKPLDSALEDLAEQTRTTIVLDRTVIEKDMPTVTARLCNTPLDSAVTVLAEMSNLRCVRLGQTFFVTSPGKAKDLEQRLNIRTAPTRPGPVTGSGM